MSTTKRPFAIFAFLAALFVMLGYWAGPASGWERDVMRALEAYRETAPAMVDAAVALTALGGILFVFGSSAAAAALLWIRGQHERAGLLLATVLIERLTVDGLKLLYARPRPGFDPEVATSSASFPSGHAANSMTAFVAIALFVAPPRYRTAAMILAATLAALVGLSRPLLGVHWPSDMVGGWLVAAGFLLSARLVADRRRLLDQPKHEIV